MEVNEEQFKESMCNGVVSRLYRHAVTGDEVSVFLVSGKSYHITIHTPDWCYVAAGFEMRRNPINYSVECPDVVENPDFRTAVFYKDTPTETNRLRILWSYTEDGRWTSPKLAKQLFGHKPALYKVYLITSIGESAPSMSEEPSVEFAKVFIPTINKVLFPNDATADTNLAQAALDVSTRAAAR